MTCREIIRRLKSQANAANVAGMARYGISSKGALGVSIPVLRGLAKEVGRDHEIALELWRSCIHEARILAALVDEPDEVTEAQMETWVSEVDSWDVCDQLMSNLFDRTRFAWSKARAWSRRDEEFVKRAGFVLMAALAVHDKKASDERFAKFLPLIRREATDGRNFVKKAVNWALRQIGKRNAALNREAVRAAEEIAGIENPAARWIARDALRELTSEKVRERLKKIRSVNLKSAFAPI